MAMNGNVGQRLRLLRQRAGIGVRALAKQAGVAAAMVSYVENGKSSPSIVMLEKLLAALDTDMASFFGGSQPVVKGPIFPRQSMKLIADNERSYTLIFPRVDGIALEMQDEMIQPGKTRPAIEERPCDVAGYILAGNMMLEVRPKPARRLRPGDAFYIPAGMAHRGYACGGEPARLITVTLPARSGIGFKKQAKLRCKQSV